MPADSQEPFYGYEQEYYGSKQVASGAWTAQQRKIDPMGLLGKIFVGLGLGLIVLGLLLTFLLGQLNDGRFGFYFVTLAGTWGTGLIFALVGLAQLLLIRDVASAQVLDAYLAALVNQDYATAFQWLDPDLKTPQTDLDARTWFVQRAQAYDETGDLLDYTLRSFGLNPMKATYTIKLRRSNQQPYTVRFVLLKKYGMWRITTFDRF